MSAVSISKNRRHKWIANVLSEQRQVMTPSMTGDWEKQTILVEIGSSLPKGHQAKSVCIAKDPALQPGYLTVAGNKAIGP